MDLSSSIHIIITGGTIDSHWDAKTDTVVPNEHSIIPEYLNNLRLYSKFEFSEICMKDSRKLTHEDLQQVVEAVEESPHTRIIITHGTYTMPDTARFIAANLKRKDQTIILTGSMAPLKGFDASDGPFSLGYALAKVQDLPAGIYLCMNGANFTPDEVAKDVSQGRFYSIFKGMQ